MGAQYILWDVTTIFYFYSFTSLLQRTMFLQSIDQHKYYLQRSLFKFLTLLLHCSSFLFVTSYIHLVNFCYVLEVRVTDQALLFFLRKYLSVCSKILRMTIISDIYPLVRMPDIMNSYYTLWTMNNKLRWLVSSSKFTISWTYVEFPLYVVLILKHRRMWVQTSQEG